MPDAKNTTELTRQTKLYLSPDGLDVLKEHASRSNLSMSRTIEALIHEVLKPELPDLRKSS